MNNKNITNLKKYIAEYSFSLSELSDIQIKIRLFKYIEENSENIYFETSHYIQVPEKELYISGVKFGITEELALKRAIKTITENYEDAIKKGYQPNPEWLIKNSNF